MRTKIAAPLGLFVLLGISFAGCSTPPEEPVPLRVGTSGEYRPFSFVEGARSGLATAWVHADTADWDQADGLSFYVKGDGSQSWGGRRHERLANQGHADPQRHRLF